MKTALLASVLCALLLTGCSSNLFAFGDATPFNEKGVSIHVLYANGGATTLVRPVYASVDCVSDGPGYRFFKQGLNYNRQGVRTDDLSTGDLWAFSKDIYEYGGHYNFGRPRQDPSCAEELLAFARSVGVSVTEVVYLNSTIVEKVYTNQTVWVCPDGNLSLNKALCVIPTVQKAADSILPSVPTVVAEPKSWVERALDWFRGLFSA